MSYTRKYFSKKAQEIHQAIMKYIYSDCSLVDVESVFTKYKDCKNIFTEYNSMGTTLFVDILCMPFVIHQTAQDLAGDIMGSLVESLFAQIKDKQIQKAILIQANKTDINPLQAQKKLANLLFQAENSGNITVSEKNPQKKQEVTEYLSSLRKKYADYLWSQAFNTRDVVKERKWVGVVLNKFPQNPKNNIKIKILSRKKNQVIHNRRSADESLKLMRGIYNKLTVDKVKLEKQHIAQLKVHFKDVLTDKRLTVQQFADALIILHSFVKDGPMLFSNLSAIVYPSISLLKRLLPKFLIMKDAGSCFVEIICVISEFAKNKFFNDKYFVTILDNLAEGINLLVAAKPNLKDISYTIFALYTLNKNGFIPENGLEKARVGFTKLINMIDQSEFSENVEDASYLIYYLGVFAQYDVILFDEVNDIKNNLFLGIRQLSSVDDLCLEDIMRIFIGVAGFIKANKVQDADILSVRDALRAIHAKALDKEKEFANSPTIEQKAVIKYLISQDVLVAQNTEIVQKRKELVAHKNHTSLIIELKNNYTEKKFEAACKNLIDLGKVLLVKNKLVTLAEKDVAILNVALEMCSKNRATITKDHLIHFALVSVYKLIRDGAIKKQHRGILLNGSIQLLMDDCRLLSGGDKKIDPRSLANAAQESVTLVRIKKTCDINTTKDVNIVTQLAAKCFKSNLELSIVQILVLSVYRAYTSNLDWNKTSISLVADCFATALSKIKGDKHEFKKVKSIVAIIRRFIQGQNIKSHERSRLGNGIIGLIKNADLRDAKNFDIAITVSNISILLNKKLLSKKDYPQIREIIIAMYMNLQKDVDNNIVVEFLLFGLDNLVKNKVFIQGQLDAVALKYNDVLFACVDYMNTFKARTLENMLSAVVMIVRNRMIDKNISQLNHLSLFINKLMQSLAVKTPGARDMANSIFRIGQVSDFVVLRQEDLQEAINTLFMFLTKLKRLVEIKSYQVNSQDISQCIDGIAILLKNKIISKTYLNDNVANLFYLVMQYVNYDMNQAGAARVLFALMCIGKQDVSLSKTQDTIKHILRFFLRKSMRLRTLYPSRRAVFKCFIFAYDYLQSLPNYKVKLNQKEIEEVKRIEAFLKVADKEKIIRHGENKKGLQNSTPLSNKQPSVTFFKEKTDIANQNLNSKNDGRKTLKK